jgi:hypothetical protein
MIARKTMIKKIFTITMLITAYGAYAMDEATQIALDKVHAEPITTPDQLQDLITISSQMFNKIYEKSPLEIPGQERYSQKRQGGERFQQLVSKKNRKDTFFYIGETKIGGVATHLDETNPKRVILDKGGYCGQPEQSKIFLLATMQFIKSAYPQAETVWCATPKNNEGSANMARMGGYKESEFMDDLHDAQFSQGWERSLKQ